MLRIFALCEWFIHNIRMRLDRRPLILGKLTLKEIDNANQNIIKLVQVISSSIEMETLWRKHPKYRNGNTHES
uniref:Uncharacterized protein n=1 Tax=Schistosoma mansoni TaxID=6183 RepID=A0A5K4F4X6_SCHMA